MIWFNFKRTRIGSPCSSAKPAEAFSPSTYPDYQCEFALYQQLTTVRLTYLPFRYKDPKFWFNLLCCRLPSPPVQCVLCLTGGSWGLQLPEWFFSVLLTPHLLHQREGAGLPPSWRHLDSSVVGHMQCRQGDLRGQGTAARNFKWKPPKNILHPLDHPNFTGWHRQQGKLLRWPEFHIKELTFSACLQTEWMIFWSNFSFLPGLFREDFYLVPGPSLRGDRGLPYIVWGVV